MKKFLAIVLLLALPGCAVADAFQRGWEKGKANREASMEQEREKLAEAKWKPALGRFIEAVKTDNPDKIGDHIAYPLRRKNPLPPVKDKADFVARYDDIFDDKLKAAIINSDVDEDWSQVGWRGIIYRPTDLISMPGAMWFQDDENGKLYALNYHSPREIELGKKLAEKDRSDIFEALRDFESNATILETDKFVIRIDRMADNSDRYAAWSKPKSMSDEPDIVIKDGTWHWDGSGGNRYYIFKNGKYVYICYIIKRSVLHNVSF
jgi:hypothetical protein